MTSRNVGFFTKSAEFYDGFVKYSLVMHMHMQAVSLIAKKKKKTLFIRSASGI